MSYTLAVSRMVPAPAVIIWPVLRDVTDELVSGVPTVAGEHPGASAAPTARLWHRTSYAIVEQAYLFHITLRRRDHVLARDETVTISLAPHAAGTLLQVEGAVATRHGTPGALLRQRTERHLAQLADRVLARVTQENVSLSERLALC